MLIFVVLTFLDDGIFDQVISLFFNVDSKSTARIEMGISSE